MADLGIEINMIIPDKASVEDLQNLPRAWFNFIPYRELGLMAAEHLQREYEMPYVDITPMGVVETARCIRAMAKVINQQGGVMLTMKN